MAWTVERLDYSDEGLGLIDLPKRRMEIVSGFGSGLATRAGDPPGTVWAVGDRGPNLKVKTARGRFGVGGLEAAAELDGAKIMPRPDLGPVIARLRVSDGRVETAATFRLTGADGRPVSGLPMPDSGHGRCEPAFDLDGKPIEPDPSGLDTEGIAALPDGGFWVGDEFGPSLVRLDGQGRVLKRVLPEGSAAKGAAYPVEDSLPAIAAKRRLNRGFEALALSADGRALFLVFQSPLSHPDVAAHEAARHVRLWRLDAETAEVMGQWLYPLDPPESFRRDAAKGKVERGDIKVSELLCLGGGALLVLERASETTKLYRVAPRREDALPPEHLDAATRPTVEELSGRELSGRGALELPVLEKTLIFTTDDAPEVAADLEGMALLSPHELLLVNDNDFGVEGAATSFWRVRFEAPVLA